MKLSLLKSHASVCNTTMVGFDSGDTVERMLNSCVMYHHTGPAPGNTVWGSIAYHSRTPLVCIASTLNSQRYISEVLDPSGGSPSLGEGVISEPDLLTTSESEILEGFSDQGVIQLDILIAKFARTFRTLCAVSSARGSDTLKLPVAVNLLALDVHLLDMLPQIAV
ncbi:transposable element Tcb1 transposase [Trichonephila clavipes]|nr:transposable element Tcb1 transposase [Trichonephila clavipes]